MARKGVCVADGLDRQKSGCVCACVCMYVYDVRRSGCERLSSQANDSGCCPLSCTDRNSTCLWVGRKSQVRQLEGGERWERWVRAGWQRIYDIQGVDAARPHGGNDAGEGE